jgi:hypothetical protein
MRRRRRRINPGQFSVIEQSNVSKSPSKDAISVIR